jgi:uncharacterized protein with GYD domain
MPTYITLYRWTQAGAEQIKDSPARLDAAKQAMRSAGVELKGFYLTMGQYDMVAVWEAPDDETWARAALALGAKGSVRSETLRAFTEEEYRRIVAALP